MTIPPNVTVCITSCGRLDLLAETLATFQRFNFGGTYLLSEDSADPAIIAKVHEIYADMEVLSGPQQLGLMGAIDRLYSRVTTPYIFHLEDDWAFNGPVDWATAIAALDHPHVANVSVRTLAEIKPKFRQRSTTLSIQGTDLRLMKANAHPEFFGWSPNPGLIKTELYHRYAPFSAYMPDTLSGIIKRDGQRMAYLLSGVAHHIGQNRNIPDPTMPARPKSRPAKWLRALKKKLYYAGWRKEPF